MPTDISVMDLNTEYCASERAGRVLAEVALDENCFLHQYTGIGHPKLMKNVVKLYSPLIGHDLKPSTEMIITCGAREALYAAILGHVDKGDEVVVIEPCYKCYVPLILFAGGLPRYVPLRLNSNSSNIKTSADWVLDVTELSLQFNQKTKLLIVNNPHSPLGKVFSVSELEVMADLCRRFNVICLSDEVLEWMVFEPATHVRMATLPDMWHRTITVCSGSKSLQVPGWMVGWTYGPETLVQNMKIAMQNSGYTPLQEAIARLLEDELCNSSGDYFSSMRRALVSRRDALINTIRSDRLTPVIPEAGYYVVADFTKLDAEEASVKATPLTSFYSEEHRNIGKDFVAMCCLQFL